MTKRQHHRRKSAGTDAASKPATVDARLQSMMPTLSVEASNGKRSTYVVLCFVSLVIVAYLPVILHGGFIWDDDDYVTENLTLRSLTGLWQIWFKPGVTHQYYPLVHTSFWIEHKLWGLWSPGFHAVNVLLHACNAVLVWGLLRRLAVPGALLAAGIFALHPVHAESVAWITERKNVLSGLFYLFSLGAFFRAVPDLACIGRSVTKRTFRTWYAISLVCFIGALLSKTVTCTFPAVLLLIAWWKHGRVPRRYLLITAPFFVLGIGLAAITVWLETNQVGAQGREWSFSFVERLLIAGRALWFYPSKIIWPYPLAFFYPKWDLSSSSLLQWMFPVSFMVLVAALIAASRRIGRGPATAVLFAAGTLFPALGFINVYPMRYSFVADHFQYLASVGWIALFTAIAWNLLQRSLVRPERLAASICIVLVPLLVWLTFDRARVLSSAELLWRDTIDKNPTSDIAHDNLGNLLTAQGKFDEGLQHYLVAISHDPNDDFAHYNAGVNLYRQGRVDEAITHYREAIGIEPRYFEAHFNLGKALESKGQIGQAQESYQRSTTINPRFVPARIGLAVLLVNTGKREEAIDQYNKVLQIDPSNTTALYNLGAVLLRMGKKAEAAEQFRELLRIDPNDAGAREMLEKL